MVQDGTRPQLLSVSFIIHTNILKYNSYSVQPYTDERSQIVLKVIKNQIYSRSHSTLCCRDREDFPEVILHYAVEIGKIFHDVWVARLVQSVHSTIIYSYKVNTFQHAYTSLRHQYYVV